MYIDSILNTLKLISLWPRLARALPQQFHATLALLTLKKLPKILLVQKRVKRLPKPSRFCPIGVCQLLHAFFPEASGWLPPHAPADTVRSVSPGFRSPGKRRTWRARARRSAPAGGRPCSDVAGPPVSRSRARSSPGQGRGGERDLGLQRQDSLTGVGGLSRASAARRERAALTCGGAEGGSVSDGGGSGSFSQKSLPLGPEGSALVRGVRAAGRRRRPRWDAARVSATLGRVACCVCPCIFTRKSY